MHPLDMGPFANRAFIKLQWRVFLPLETKLGLIRSHVVK
jgi:hypothetical protein